MPFDLNKEIANLQSFDYGVHEWDKNEPHKYWRTQITHSAKGYRINIHSDGYIGCKANGKTIEEAWKNALTELEEHAKTRR